MAIEQARHHRLLGLILASACTPPAARTAHVVLALEPVPESVASLSVSVREVERDRIVASATVAAPHTTFDLELPAETPLEIRVVARTSRPGPAVLGAMPAYFGSIVRTIPLGSQQALIALTVHRAGVLTLTARPAPELARTLVNVMLRGENATTRPVVFALDPRKPMLDRSFVLPAGRYTLIAARIVDPSDESRTIQRVPGIFVAPETESISRITIQATTSTPAAGAAQSLDLTLLGEGGAPLPIRDVIPTRADRATPIQVRALALDGAGRATSVSNALVRVSVAAVPSTIASGPGSVDATGLPATLRGFLLRGSGRVVFRATADLGGGTTINGALAANVLEPGQAPGRAEKIALAVINPALLPVGALIDVSILDGQGLFAQTHPGMLDLSRSDPWAFLPSGPGGEVSRAERGHLVRRIARPSGPRGSPVILRATLTSTAIPLSLSSTIALPLVEGEG